MSQETYTKKWRQAHADLNRILHIERPKKSKPLSSYREICFSDFSVRYIKYTTIYRTLKECYDHMIHPQKRVLIVRCLEGVAGRIVELHTEMVRLSLTEYVNLVDVCMDLKVLPQHLELTLCKALFIHRVQELRQRVNFLDYILETMGADNEEEVVTENVYTITEAILLIQRNERAFQARTKLEFTKKRKTLTRRYKPDTSGEINISGIVKFQALWRRFQIRNMIGGIRRDNDIFLRMTMPVYRDSKVRDREIEMIDLDKAQTNDDHWKEDMIIKFENYVDSEGPATVENMKKEILQWAIEYRDLMGTFPQFPSEEEGGSLALFSNKTIEQMEADLDDLMEGAKAKSAKKGEGEKDTKKDQKKEQKSGAKKGEGQPYTPKPSQFIDQDLIPCALEYGKYWLDKDESDNRLQEYDNTLLMEDINANVETLLRQQVDELIREELVRLEKGIDYMKPGKAKPKKEKKNKKDKKKKTKDMTAGIPLEDLYKELVLAGIIKKAPIVRLQDFLGKVNLMTPSDIDGVEFKHDLGDVRKMVFDYAILPMSSEVIHRRAPFKKSIILVGPHGSGKRMLVHAICTELGANLIDLSPDKLVGKYEGSAAQKRLIHLASKVGKLMEPSVIYIKNCDRMFTKKLPPEDTTNPARLKGDLMKLLKSITPDDRILIVGTTSYPFKAALAPMFKLYERMIFIYPPSSASRFALWTKFIIDGKGIIHDQFDVTSLARVSQGYTAGDIKNAAMEVLSENRLRRQSTVPLTTREFILRLVTFDPVFQEELEEFEAWLLKTPLKKKLLKIQEMEAEGQDVSALL